MLAHWSEETPAQAERWSDTGLVRDGLCFFDELPQSAPAEVLLATDLHAGNALHTRREPWLVIDPKPFIGDPAYDATQHLLNCLARLRSTPTGPSAAFRIFLKWMLIAFVCGYSPALPQRHTTGRTIR
jgi:streptomycin 6-kinase